MSQRIRDIEISPSTGAAGTVADSPVMESFWARIQVELLNRQRWKTRIEPATAIHDYIELKEEVEYPHRTIRTLIWTADDVTDIDHAEIGTEVEVLWGNSNGPQRRIRAQVAPAPYKSDNRRAGLTTIERPV